MPANYVLLGKVTLGASAASVTFSNIPQSGYTDLKIVASARGTQSSVNQSYQMTFNGTSTTGLSMKRLYGNGASAASDSGLQNIEAVGATATSNTFSNDEIYIPNYTSANYKSYSIDNVGETNAATAYAILHAGLWSNTAAITSIVFTGISGSFVQYSTFYLYGLAAVGTTPVIAPFASGGDSITTDGTYWYHAFLSSGTFTPAKALTASCLVIAGGGGGSSGEGAGGGAGGVSYLATSTLSSSSYTVTVGGGGAGGAQNSAANPGTTGSDSSFNSIISNGGGGAKYNNGLSGGSGGGTYFGYTGGAATQGNTGGATGYGNAGAIGFNSTSYNGGGGGGAGGAGGNATGTRIGGTGGAGLGTWSTWATATSTGVSGYYAGGGGGGAGYGASGGTGGSATGGGGAGASNGKTAGTAGTANTGGGGGGANANSDSNADSAAGGTGGSGIVIIRYPMV